MWVCACVCQCAHQHFVSPRCVQDMFYAAVEMLDNPSLRGKPVAVGGMSMISTANYEARRYGPHTHTHTHTRARARVG